MKLIGMLDSPYVRRAAVCLRVLDIAYEHEAVSVFRHFDRFHSINPVVKAPTLVLDDGRTLMDSTLIIDYAMRLSGRGERLVPAAASASIDLYRLTGLALAANEKTVQIVYEELLRPAEKRHAPWIARVSSQLLAACSGLESEITQRPAFDGTLDLASISIATAWTFMQQMQPDVVKAADYPALAAYAAAVEQHPILLAIPPL
ncbi:glutathione S-transferase [Amantichitinum ursilacus]|uniref:Putative GST-like protein YibF n=1 Tax=Amantichitinum ursilacus TaxID=857265 RepID=A0A0N0GPR2_9NEIS|nr:glutathione S-transferase [Amantichitinum ursilacus]KPC53731.1 putative GST-like protein YibF [Amantichitinum ursilacus]